ncbi:hypothetical protein [Deinococcus roseus]|uniref:EF-hand domain-containing protein n=1 Tax=Deinococcus roseus TaxID=392414 RepID=A0ABQ2CWB2_9DEIO|nr:hypothetical protein [Deinococcus roseus]GGJ20271.1 hypothetical protein GCM10008938_03100 [Deinococcus roseus]
MKRTLLLAAMICSTAFAQEKYNLIQAADKTSALPGEVITYLQDFTINEAITGISLQLGIPENTDLVQLTVVSPNARVLVSIDKQNWLPLSRIGDGNILITADEFQKAFGQAADTFFIGADTNRDGLLDGQDAFTTEDELGVIYKVKLRKP